MSHCHKTYSNQFMTIQWLKINLQIKISNPLFNSINSTDIFYFFRHLYDQLMMKVTFISEFNW